MISNDHKIVLHIGVDDTDSLEGMCTTYLAYRLVRLLTPFCKLVDFPNLIRLNPNIPLKTRGNGAICLRYTLSVSNISKVKNLVLEAVGSLAHLQDPRTNSGVAFFEGEVIPPLLSDFSSRALSEVLSLHEAKSLASRLNIEFHGWKKGFGLIGALAAIGSPLIHSDYTYELIVYRSLNTKGVRKADYSSVFDAARKVKDQFNNVDFKNKEILIFPRGLDPVLCGIRGENPQAVLSFYEEIKIFEEPEGLMLFRTNQHTGIHLTTRVDIGTLKPFTSALIGGNVTKPPIYQNKHLFFRISDGTGEVDCAVYEPTRQFRQICSHLIKGDQITIGGGVRAYPRTINVEYLYTDSLVKIFGNPKCPSCGKNLTSMGKAKGYKCKKCKIRSQEDTVSRVPKERSLKEKGVFLPPICAHRHLTKPKERFNHEKKQFDFQDLYWISFIFSANNMPDKENLEFSESNNMLL